MATPNRASPDALSLFSELAEKPWGHNFFQTLRRIESLYPDKPLFGTAARPADEPVRLGQEPSLAFAPSTLAEFKPGGEDTPHRLQSYFFGLFGPNAPLPLHLTEYARDRERQDGDETLRRFADVFHHRLLMLFYRAWANARPAIGLDRPTPRRIDDYVGSTFGIGAPEFRSRDAVDDNAKLYLAGRMALQTRPTEGLLAILEEYMEQSFSCEQFVGEWAQLSREDWPALGVPGSSCVLGQDAVLGRAVWNCQHKFRLACGPLKLNELKRLLPGQPSLERLRDLVRGYVGLVLEWDLNLVLEGKEIPGCRLGRSGELGWTSWLGNRKGEEDAKDILIRPNAALTRI